MNEGRAGNGSPMSLEAIAVYRDRAALDVDDVGVGTNSDVVFHGTLDGWTVGRSDDRTGLRVPRAVTVQPSNGPTVTRPPIQLPFPHAPFAETDQTPVRS